MKVAILKGGKHRHQESLESAKNIFTDLKNTFEVEDIYIDKNNTWYVKGIKTDPHFVLPHFDHIVDTTFIRDHEPLIKKLGLTNILDHELDVHNYRKILKQSHIKIPEYHLYKAGDEVHKKIYDSWRSLHVPVVVRGTSKISPKLIAYSPNEIISHADFIFQKGENVILENFVRGRSYHIVTISKFRNKDTYKSVILESISKKDRKEYVRAISLSEHKKAELEKYSEDVHKILGLTIARLDFVLTGAGNFYLINISNKLSFREGGLSEALFRNSGVGLAEYISGL